MIKKVRILRKQMGTKHYEEFTYEGGERDSVAKILTSYNDDIISGKRSGEQIAWECSCMVRRCGACAMRINGVPRLACSAFLHEFGEKEICLEPLSKFPHIKDLVTDRKAVFDALERTKIWLEKKAAHDEKKHKLRYESSKCIACGCCLEVCPNFNSESAYTGVITAVNAYRITAAADDRLELKDKKRPYAKYYYEGCGLSLSCHDICPIGLPIEELAARSNAAMIWGRSV